MRPEERRGSRRFARRSQVRYRIKGKGGFRSGFVKDISSTGLFIASAVPVVRGTEIEVEVVQDDGTTLQFEAVVARKVWRAPDLRLLGPSGFGARFMTPEELVDRLRGDCAASEPTMPDEDGMFRVVLDDPPGHLARQIGDLEQGGLFVSTDEPPALNADVVIELVHGDGAGSRVRAQGRVVQRVRPGQGGTIAAGMAVHLADAPAVLEKLRPYLAS